MDCIRDRIILYMRDVVRINPELIPGLREKYLEEFGTTFAGLKRDYEIDKQDYLEFVHDIDLSQLLEKGQSLGNLLSDFSQRKVIFTSANLAHAEKVLKYLGIKGHFEKIIDIQSTLPHLKPHPHAFKKLLEMLNYESWEGCLFVDDQLLNVETACEIGLQSILIDESLKSDFRPVLKDIYGLREFMEDQLQRGSHDV